MKVQKTKTATNMVSKGQVCDVTCVMIDMQPGGRKSQRLEVEKRMSEGLAEVE